MAVNPSLDGNYMNFVVYLYTERLFIIMARPRKYPKTTGYYVYVHVTPDKMCYFGMSKQQPSKRWTPSHYKGTALQPGIEEFGWDNIEHMVIQDGLTKHQAEVIEDWFIKNATKDRFCLNDRRSGGIARDNIHEWRHEYNREYQKTEKRKAYLREYYREYSKTEKYKEYQREYQCQYYLKKKLQTIKEQ